MNAFEEDLGSSKELEVHVQSHSHSVGLKEGGTRKGVS